MCFYHAKYVLVLIMYNESFYIYEDAKMVNEVVQSRQNSGLIFEAGIATSLTNTGQQW